MRNTFDCRGPRCRGLGLTAMVLAAILLPGCNESTTIPDVPRAVIILAVDPDPAIGTQNTLTGSVSVAYVVQIRELAGLGGTINFINSIVFDPETGLQVSNDYYDSANLKVFVGTDRIEPGGELDVTRTASYTLPDFRINADLAVSVQVIDDQGNLINYSTLVRVVPPE